MFTVNTNSWHYRWLAYNFVMRNLSDYERYRKMRKEYDEEYTYADHYEYLTYRPIEFCSYWRQVLLWPFVRIISTMAILAATIWVASQIPLGAAALIFGQVVLMLGGIIAFFAVGIWSLEKYAMIRRARRDKEQPKEPGFFSTMHTMYREKICPLVQYKKESENENN